MRNGKNNKIVTLSLLVLLVSLIQINHSFASNDFKKAKEKGQIIFMVITGNGAIGLDNATNTANQAALKTSNSVVIVIDKDDPNNKNIVDEYGISAVPVPFVMIISCNGLPVFGNMANRINTDILVNAVPTPKQDKVILAISQKKPLFIIVSKKNLSDKAAIINNCNVANKTLTPPAEIIEIDFQDKKETKFLRQLGVTNIANQTITVVANASGQITDTYTGMVLPSALVSSVKKVAKSGGCCPGGATSGKGC